MMKRSTLLPALVCIFAFCFSGTLTAQNPTLQSSDGDKSVNQPKQDPQPSSRQFQMITDSYDLDKLEAIRKEFQAREAMEMNHARSYALLNNIPLRKENADGSFDELQMVLENGTPIYYKLHNTAAARSTRADYLNTGGGLGLTVDGAGMTAHVWDGGPTRPTHEQFDGTGGSNRVTINDGATTLNGNSFHAQHVTGTIVASGQISGQTAAKGMAWQAQALTHDWNSDLSEAAAEAASGMLISNHSYGFRANLIPDAWFGAYIQESEDWDDLMYNSPYYLMVVAAGNDGNDNSSNGSPLDGNSAYDKLNGHGTSKNNMVVANGQDASINGDGSLNSVVRNSGSSEGPTDDYRIKPDIMGNGTSLYSTFDATDSDYASISGTSMASPNVAGSLLLLQEHYNDLNSSWMRAATLKGLALHTADDVGLNGPDAQHGWGLMNTKFAAETITEANTNGDAIINELTLSQGQTYQITIQSNGTDPLMASISWTDPAADGYAMTDPPPQAPNANLPTLINDLDLRLSNGSTFYPWRMTGVASNSNGGDNSADPYERVDISGASGQYTLTVTHKGTLTNGPQNFSLIVTGGSIAVNGPEISFASTAISQPENSDCSFTDYNIQLNIGQGPTMDADVNFTVSGGTATSGVDYQLMTSSVTFPALATASQNMVIRVFHDDFLEANETVVVDFTVNANGGDATANTNADTHTFTINNDDNAPVATVDTTLLTEDWEDWTGWLSGDRDTDGNNWRSLSFSSGGYTGFSGQFAASETDLTVLGGTGSANADNYLISPAVTIPAGTTNTTFNYAVAGFNTIEHYTLYWTTDISTYGTIDAGINLEERNATANTGDIRSVSNSTLAGQTGYFVIRHETVGGANGIFLFDGLSIVATVATDVQTAVNDGVSHDEVNVDGAGQGYAYDTVSGALMAMIDNNNSFDYGCVDVGVSRSGTGGQAYHGSTGSDLVMDKMFSLDPANNAGSGNVDITFYFTEAEISGWETATGLSRNALEAIRNNAAGGSTETSSLSVGAFGGHVTLTGNFSDLEGEFAFGTPKALRCTNTRTYNGSWDTAPDAGSNVMITNNYDTNNGSIDACRCTINAGQTVTVRAGDYMNIADDITVNGTLDVEHTGSVVQSFDDAAVVKNGTINVHLTTPFLKPRDFMVMGSPMSAETRTDVFASAFLVLQHTPANFIPHPAVPAGGTNFADDNGDFWNQIAAGPINVGEGYIVRPQASYIDGNSTYDMTYTEGTLNNGTVNRTMTYNGASNPNGTPNIVANPYASPISADDFINANALVTEMYFWEHLTPPSSSFPGHGSLKFSMDDVSMYNLSGGVPAANDPGTSTEPNGIISTGQGFAVRAGSGGTVTFNNGMRRTTGNTTLRNVSPDVNTLRLRVSNTDYEYELGSNTLIAFNPLATDGLDAGYDSDRLATVVSLFSSLNDGSEELGIQTRGAFSETEKVALGFASQVQERLNFTIAIMDLQGTALSEATVYLIDNYANVVTNLNQQSYTFESGEGHFADRFSLQFEYETLSTNDLSLDSITVYPNPTTGIINLASPQAAMTQVELRDLQGRLIRTEKLDARQTATIELNGLDAAMYFVTIQTEAGAVTKRIVLK